MSELLKLILSIWIVAIVVIFYIVFRVNWAKKAIDRIIHIVLYYRKVLADEGKYKLKEYNDRKAAIDTIVFLETTTDADMIKKLLGGNRVFKNNEKVFVFKAIVKPWVVDITRSIKNKELWTLMNNKIYGKDGWS